MAHHPWAHKAKKTVYPVIDFLFVCVLGGRGQRGPGGRQRKKPGRMRHPGWAPYEVC